MSTPATPSRQLTLVPADERARPNTESVDVFRLPGLLIRQTEGKLETFLSGAAIAAAAEVLHRRDLIDRLFAVPALQSARILGKKGEIRLEFTASEISSVEIISSLSKAMLGRRPACLPLPHEEVILGDDAPDAFSVYRAGSGLTLWQIDAPSSQFFRLSHPLLRFEYIRKRVLEELGTLSDVILRSFYLPIAGSEALLVFGRPHRVDPSFFREVLDPVLSRCLAVGPPQKIPELRDKLVNANLALAAITDFLAPPLGIANIALAGVLGAGYVPRAILALRQGKFTLELLYLVIAAFTVITYEFLPAALMYWLMRYWPRRSRELYDSHQARFLASYRLQPRRVWIDQAGTSIETRVENLTSASVVTLNAGDIVPGDGHVVDGEALIDQRLLTGGTHPVAKTDGGKIYAASRVIEGSVRIRINALGDKTAVGHLARWHAEALARKNPEIHAVGNAEKTVVPVLLTTALATALGGLTMAKSVIRPDYVTGPALSEDLGQLSATIRAANAGILIVGYTPLEKLSRRVCLVLDDSIAWPIPQTGAGSFAEFALVQGIEDTAYFSVRSSPQAARLASDLGIVSHYSGRSAALKRAHIAQWQKEGRTVLYVGDCQAEAEAAAQADVAITVSAPPFDLLGHAAVTLLSHDLLKILQLRAIALDLAEERRTSFRLSLVPNVAAVVAAFLFASPVYLSVLLTNLGTCANYLRSETLLQLSHARVRE